MNKLAFKAGDCLTELRFGPIGPTAVNDYAVASLDDNPIHSDVHVARAVGLDAPVVQGMLLMGLFEHCIVAWQGEALIRKLRATFLQPVIVGGTVVVGGRVVKVAEIDDHRRLTLRMYVRDDNDRYACVGEAFVDLPRAAVSPPLL